MEAFSELTDPRWHACRYPLNESWLTALCAVRSAMPHGRLGNDHAVGPEQIGLAAMNSALCEWNPIPGYVPAGFLCAQSDHLRTLLYVLGRDAAPRAERQTCRH